MAAVRQLRQGIGVLKSLVFAPRPSNRLLSTFFSRLSTPSHTSFARPAQLSNSHARFSLPIRHALSRPFTPPRLPRPPVVPANVTQVGLGTARAFHSGRPIFQNMVDNVPIATRALWEAEWDVKMKKKEARRMRCATETKTTPKYRSMLKPRPTPLVTSPPNEPSEIDLYFPVQPVPAVTTHLLVPLAPTPTARLPLSARNDGGDAHPLLPITDLAAIHTTHRLHSLRVSTLFSRLDTANVWDDPGVNVDAYAFGPRHTAQATQEKQCTVLRVTFRGWTANHVQAILGDSAEEWYSLEETHPGEHPALVHVPDPRQTVHENTCSPSLRRVTPEIDRNEECDMPSQLPVRASASAQHDLVLPTLDFSSAFSDAVDNVPPPPQPVVFLRTISELARDDELASHSSSILTGGSWECLGSSTGQHG